MSVRTELEELAKWIADLSAEAEAPPAQATLPRKSWQRLKANLEDAAENFGKAAGKLRGTVLGEFARDVQRETEAAALRAHLLSRRVPAEPDPPEQAKPAEAVISPPAPVLPPAPDRGAEAQPKAKAAAGAPGDLRANGKETSTSGDRSGKEEEERSAGELVKSASGTVETARAKLVEVDHPDAVTARFGDDLDVLAEMSLSLLQRLHEQEPERPAEGNGKSSAGQEKQGRAEQERQ